MNEPTPTPLAAEENRLIAERRGKLARLRADGIAYPNDFQPDSQAAALHQAYGELEKEELEHAGKQVKVAGRMMLKRVMGKASFATLQHGSGRIQVFLDRNTV
ncbi:MAG: lysine--tRNA ligase, partial [Alcaligenaceae bacterium]|nr:lysine--tRNA ligase [Alcaligenaceae bacterium]